MNCDNPITQECSVTRPEVDQAREAPLFKPCYTSRYDEQCWTVEVVLPGVRKEDVKATVENEVLDVQAFRVFELPEGWRPLGDDRFDRRYRLRLDVGPEVDPVGVSAKMEDGILVLRLPLREESKPRSIEVQ